MKATKLRTIDVDVLHRATGGFGEMLRRAGESGAYGFGYATGVVDEYMKPGGGVKNPLLNHAELNDLLATGSNISSYTAAAYRGRAAGIRWQSGR